MKTILIVDDDNSVQETLSVYIQKFTDYKTVCVEDGEAAIDLIKNEKPDLILLDIFLPVIGGYALFQDLQKNELTKEIPVIFITGGLVDEVFKQEGLDMGAVDYITKPFDLDYLIKKINSILN
ncbi:PleD family two-component system response regulator [candidate division KSB1 bacterium]